MEEEIERIWPTPQTEARDRAKYPAEWTRYEFAARYAAGKRVLDCACGAGYGSALLLRSGAVSVVGVDVSKEAVAHARKHFAGPDFREGDGTTLPLPSGSVDLVVSLETIEHASDPRLFADELARVLGDGGLLVLSTPLTYGEARLKPQNPFHLREFDDVELAAFLEPRFEILERLGQHSSASRGFADLKSSSKIVRSGLHRIVPRPLRTLLRRFLRKPSLPAAWVSAERWKEAPVQVVVARRRSTAE
jgi:SAM-dependent methyltransferase